MELRFQLFHILFGNVVALLVKAHVSYARRLGSEFEWKKISLKWEYFIFVYYSYWHRACVRGNVTVGHPGQDVGGRQCT